MPLGVSTPAEKGSMPVLVPQASRWPLQRMQAIDPRERKNSHRNDAQPATNTGQCPVCSAAIDGIAADQRRTARPCGHSVADRSIEVLQNE